jgi:uncharacterized protein YqiB (DUF1249 family)
VGHAREDEWIRAWNEFRVRSMLDVRNLKVNEKKEANCMNSFVAED